MATIGFFVRSSSGVGGVGGEWQGAGQAAAPRVHSPARLTSRAGSSASANAFATKANFSAFEMLMRWSQAWTPSLTARVATSP